MQPQKLCLKWNNHTANLLSVLGGFQQRDILVDVTISCDGQNIKAHKMVLSACSPYFQNLFLENPCQHPIVIVSGIKYEDITAILNFMYKGEVNVSQDGLTSFLQAAEALKVKGLAEVCGEKRSTNSSNPDVQQTEQPQQPQPQNRPQRTETPPRKKHRNRKRSLSDSNRSDDEGSSRKQHREPSSPEVHELSGDESFTGDTNSNGPPFNSTPRVPQNVYSRSHQLSSNLTEDDEEYEVEPSKLLEQTLTTDNVAINNSSVDNKLRIERIMGNAEMESSSLQEPESPPDIKPIIDFGDSSAGPSEGNAMLYNEQSQPGPSSLQDGSLLHDNAHAQDLDPSEVIHLTYTIVKSNEIKVENSEPSTSLTEVRESTSSSLVKVQASRSLVERFDSEDNTSMQYISHELPDFSPCIKKALRSGNIKGPLWTNLIMQAAAFYVKDSSMKTKSDYDRVGRMMFDEYPSIKNVGAKPWSRFTKCLSQKIRSERLRKKELDKKGFLALRSSPMRKGSTYQKRD